MVEIAAAATTSFFSSSDDKAEGSTYKNDTKGITVECAGEKMKVRGGGDVVDCG